MTSLFKKALAVLLSAALLPAQMTVYAEEETKDNPDFDTYMTEAFVELMETDYLTMHYDVRDPSHYGIAEPESFDFAEASWDSYAEAAEDYEESIAELKEFDYDSLSLRQKHDYDTLMTIYRNGAEINRYPLLDSVFNPYSGVLDNFVTNMTEFAFREKRDFADYLKVLATIPQFLEECLELTRRQSAEGVFLTDTLLDETKAWIADFCAKTDDNELIRIFEGHVDEFADLSDEERRDYKAQNRALVLNEIIPALQHVSDELEKLRGTNKYEGGTANYPGGEDYYLALARYKTGSDESLEEMMEICRNYIDETLDMIIMLYSDPHLDSLYDTEAVDFSSPEEILEFHRAHLSDEYPDGPDVNYVCSYLDPTLINDAVNAYYLTPPVDDPTDNVIRVNGESVQEINDLYDTLAHEGFPGHCYQVTWYLNTNPNPLRAANSVVGYAEGWAMYTQFNSWLYSGLSKSVALMHAAELGLNYVLSAYMDMGINGLGWSVDDLRQELKDMGLNPAIAPDQYDFLISRPGMLLPYGYGLATMMRLRGKASTALGDDFDAKEFNEVLLTYGDRPFSIVEDDVDAYILSKGADLPEEGEYEYLNEYTSEAIASVPSGSSALPFVQQSGIPEETISAPVFYGLTALLAAIAVVAVIQIWKDGKKNPFGE